MQVPITIKYSTEAGKVPLPSDLGTGELAVNVRDAKLFMKQEDGAGGETIVTIGGVPSGGIMKWFGSVASIPDGWLLCDGQNGTPDLRGRFVVGAGGAYAPGDTGGQAAITEVPAHGHNLSGNTSPGGSHSHTGSTSNTGSHAHGIKSDAGSRYNSTSAYGQPKATGGLTFNTNSAGAHSHNFTTDAAANHSHTLSGTAAETGSASVDIRPPYYALCYIMKA